MLKGIKKFVLKEKGQRVKVDLKKFDLIHSANLVHFGGKVVITSFIAYNECDEAIAILIIGKVYDGETWRCEIEKCEILPEYRGRVITRKLISIIMKEMIDMRTIHVRCISREAYKLAIWLSKRYTLFGWKITPPDD